MRRGPRLISRRLSATCLAAAAAMLGARQASAAQINFDNGALSGLWENPTNWRGAGPDTLWGTEDDTDGLPTTADQPVIHDGFTASLTSPQVAGDLVVSWPTGGGSPAAPGVATLNIGPGADLVVGDGATNTSGIRLGRTATAVGASRGVINQTGGNVSIITGANGLRLSQADGGTTVSDSLYVISGGSLRGGPAGAATLNANLNIGTQLNNFNRAEFRVVGTGPTEIRFADVNLRVATPADGTGTRQAVLGFVIQDGGVTPIVAEDQFDIQNHDGATGAPTANALLEIALQGAPPEQNIVLVQADRLTPTSGAAGFVHFAAMPDNTPIVRTFGDWEYTWNLNYIDGSDDGILDAFIRLDFVSRTLVPEPGALTLFALLSACAFAHRRRRQTTAQRPSESAQ
jgi:hypothetical protein